MTLYCTISRNVFNVFLYNNFVVKTYVLRYYNNIMFILFLFYYTYFISLVIL